MREYTFTESVKLLGVDPKTARKWLVGIKAGSRPHDTRAHLYAYEQLEETASAHGRTLRSIEILATSSSSSSVSGTGTTTSPEVSEELTRLILKISKLEQRLVALEISARTVTSEVRLRPIEPRPIETLDSSQRPPMSTYKRMFMSSVVASGDRDTWPGTIRGNAAWIEGHGGPNFNTLRDWQRASGPWPTQEEAVLMIQRHRGWEGWTPS